MGCTSSKPGDMVMSPIINKPKDETFSSASDAATSSISKASRDAQLKLIERVKLEFPDNIMAQVFDRAYYNSLPDELQTRLLQCCKSGIENPDSNMGCYAMHPDDYDVLKPFFSKALSKYHKVSENAKHVNDWNLQGVAGLPDDGILDLSKLGLPALSMRVRTGRNLKAFPLPGAMTRQDRCDLENAMVKAFDKLIAMPEYGGKYISITPGHPNFVSKEVYQKYVDDHIMFKDMSADPYLLSAGIAQDWPYGRGCYVSEDKGFIVWVGEEDHLRIMCMKKGTVLNEVFDRLKKAKAIAKPLGLSVRGLGGEHTPIGKDGTVDISPSARFVIKEAEIITALYKGLRLLKEEEDKAGQPGGGAAAGGDKVQKILAIKTSHPDNIMAQTFSVDYYNSLSDELKARLLQCCNSGIDNPDSSMGCYAMRPDDYDVLKPFFSKALAKYHRVAEDAKHVNDWNLQGVAGLPADGVLDLGKLGLPALSMRVRTGRNLKAYPLPGAMTKEDRCSMENVMAAAFAKLIAMPEYGGKYISITPGHPNFVSKEVYQQYVDDHIMFKDMSADPYLLSAGIAQDWPYGRGCYVSEDKGFIIWVGEEDHLRIMCMKKGTVLNEVFDRLKKAIDVVESLPGCEFAYSPDYGVVTSCPTNLGTAMRASVHIPLPNLTSDGTDKKAKAIAKPLGLSVRGLGGEHTPIGKDGTVDISPSARFVIKEAEIITALYKGLRLLKEEEDKAGQPGGGAAAGGDKVQKILAIKTSHPDNIMAQTFSVDYYNSLSDELKARLLQCCNSGIDNPDSSMGCYAMRPDDYDVLKPFFSKALAKYHRVAEDAKHVNDWNLQGVAGLPADGVLDLGKLGLPALSMRVRTGRNLKAYPLPGAMTKEDRCSMENVMAAAFAKLIAMPEYGGKYISITPDHPNFVSKEVYQQYVDDHIMFKDMSADPYLLSAGIAQDWPYGRGCYVSEDKGFIIWVGEEDHLRIMCMKKGTVLNEVFDRLKKAIDVVESLPGCEFAYSPDYGVVTSCPTNLGTAMRASVHIPLPNLTSDGTDKKAKAIAKPLGLSVRGLGGEHTPIGKDGTVDISPSARFVIKEAEIITALYKGLRLLKEAEDAAVPEPVPA
eukprot:jgi/Mesvir1/1440/Mv25482-RA.2